MVWTFDNKNETDAGMRVNPVNPGNATCGPRSVKNVSQKVFQFSFKIDLGEATCGHLCLVY